MAASIPVPKDLPREAEVNLDEQQRLNSTTDSDDSDDGDEDEAHNDEEELQHGHSHAHGTCQHPHDPHGHSHAHHDSGHRQHVRFSQTPVGGMLVNILQSIPFVTASALKILPLTNVVAFLLASARLLPAPASSSCSVSLLPSSGGPDFSRVLLSLFFDNSYASFFGSLFAMYELGSRLETLKSSLHFALVCVAYIFATSLTYYMLLLHVPVLAAFPCSVGFWPIIIALSVTDSLHSPLQPRSFPFFPYAVPPISLPVLLLIAHQVLFAIHPFPIVALPLAYVLHWPLHAVVRVLSVVLERSWCAVWLGRRSDYISVGKAASMPPWAPINNAGEPLPADDSVHTSPEPVVVSELREPRVSASQERRSPRKLVQPQPPQPIADLSDDGEDEWKGEADIETGSSHIHPRADERAAEEHKLLHTNPS